MKSKLTFLFITLSLVMFASKPPFDLTKILQSGDGKSIETAYKVNSVQEEYLVIDYLKLKSIAQKLIIKDGFFIDAIYTKSKTIYFKIIEKKIHKKVKVLTT